MATFKENWDWHVKELSRLGWSLPEPKDRERLDAIQAELADLVQTAAKENARFVAEREAS